MQFKVSLLMPVRDFFGCRERDDFTTVCDLGCFSDFFVTIRHTCTVVLPVLNNSEEIIVNIEITAIRVFQELAPGFAVIQFYSVKPSVESSAGPDPDSIPNYKCYYNSCRYK
jgi:hypothetical protein